MNYSKAIRVALFAWQLVTISLDSAHAAVGTLADGDIVGWGFNQIGQINAPAGTFMAIAAGNNHSIGLRSDGSLVGWGNNADGQTDTPAGVFTAVAAAGNYSLALRTDGILIAWGTNSNGQRGVPAGTYTAAAAGTSFGLGLQPNGTVTGWGSNVLGVITVPAGVYAAVAAGDGHSLGLRTNGTLAGWGDNASGQTSVPSGTFAAIAAGGVHSVGLRSDGTVTHWGTYRTGQATAPTGAFTSIAAGGEHSLGIRADGTLAGWGYNFYGQTNVPAGIFTAVAGGGNHSLGLRARTEYDGDLRIFGAGTTARLNRSVHVTGDLIVETPIQRLNNAIAEVEGRLVLRNTANLSDGVYYVHGMQVDNAFTLPANVAIANSGPLTGSAALGLSSGSHLDIGLASANAYSGALSLSPSASVTLNGAGVQSAYLLGVSDGAIFRMGPAQRMRTTNVGVGFGLLNSGRIELFGSDLLGPSTLEIQGRSTNSGGNARITARDALLQFTGGLVNESSIVFTGGVNDISGDIVNNSTGKVVVSGGVRATFYDDVVQNGSLQVSRVGGASSTAVFLDSFTGSQGGVGGGDILFEGDVHPGSGPGAITFDNNVLLGAGGSLVLELGGAAPGSQYDQLRINGSLTLGSMLQVSLINGFAPSSGQAFNILDWTSLSGTFSSISLPTLGAGIWDVSQLYTTGVLSVTASTNADFNGNGLVDAGDLANWKGGFGVNAGAARGQGDADGDRDVDGADFLAWQRRVGGAAATTASATVPEPAARTMFALLFAAATAARSSLLIARRSDPE